MTIEMKGYPHDNLCELAGSVGEANVTAIRLLQLANLDTEMRTTDSIRMEMVGVLSRLGDQLMVATTLLESAEAMKSTDPFMEEQDR